MGHVSQKVTIATLNECKQQQRPIAMLTCYDYATAVLLQEAGVESLLVGDSLAQVMLGYPTTLSADIDLMIALATAVRKGAPDTYLIGDMPFLSYQASTESAFRNAGRFLSDAGCDAVKLEVTRYHLPLIEALTAAGIPVMAHIGLRPQSLRQMGAYKAQGQDADQAAEIVADARAMVQAGAGSLLLECVTAETAQAVTQSVVVPVIGCGSGPHCDGQVLVLHDILGLPGAGQSRFVRQFGQVGPVIREAARSYMDAVREKTYPDDDHSYHMKPAERDKFHRRNEQSDPET